MPRRGAVAERLGRGLQSLVQRFESARRLRRSKSGRFAAMTTLVGFRFEGADVSDAGEAGIGVAGRR
jgi:hypothetical protein